MRIGGNNNAQTYFRKHGATSLHSKIEKKYTSKVAQAYKTVLIKLVEAEAVKRGEGLAAANEAGEGADLLAHLELADRASTDSEARTKLAAARSAGHQQAIPQAKLASSLAGASKLVVTPPNSGGVPKLKLIKPGAGNKGGFNMMKKKPVGASKMKISTKLGVKPEAAATNGTAAATATDDFDHFEAPKEEASEPEAPAPTPVVPAPAPAPVKPKEFSMKEGVDKLKGMNSDFFSSF